MKKRLLSLSLIFSTLAISLSGCGADNKAYPNGVLYVYNWGEYIDEDVITSFEEEYGINVIYDTFDSNETMYANIASGGTTYDVACPSDYMIQKMIQNDMLEPLDYSQIPNLKNIDQEYMKKSEVFDPGNVYSVPYCWGTVGILYNKTMVDGPITSWSALFDPQYKNNILMIESVRDAYMIALQYLGYDLNTTNTKEIQEATALLKQQYDLVDAYVVDQVRDKMIGGEDALGVIYSGEAIYTQRENPDLEFVVPEEGSNVWIDSWVLLKDSKNKENALKWINYMSDADIALKNFDYITYSTPNKAARELIEDEEIKNSEVAFPGLDILGRCTAYSFLGDSVEQYYLDQWNRVKTR